MTFDVRFGFRTPPSPTGSRPRNGNGSALDKPAYAELAKQSICGRAQDVPCGRT